MKVMFDTNVILDVLLERPPSSSWRRCRRRFGVGERADTQAVSPSIRAGTMCPQAQQSPFISDEA